jgi:phosphoribosylaminoimidazole-succinocarboxamide synthase
LFGERGISCADFKLEVGIDAEGALLLGDELTPNDFRLRDTETGTILDKDVFRLDCGDLKSVYSEVLIPIKRLNLLRYLCIRNESSLL